jgi:chemotaxis protein methyltransferase WspC
MAPINFEHLLKASMGLDAASIGSSAIERAVQERQSVRDLPDRQVYWEQARGCDVELQALIEAVVVPETWFFRDREAFLTLARLCREQCQPAPNRMFRLLSLPASTGEEPYSMAMALLDVGLSPDRWRIDAVDVSGRAIAQAERAEYGRNSFRGHDLGFRDRYFEPIAGGYRLSEAVRARVHFQQGNLFGADFLPGTEMYDAIFCRNLLIYFDRETQDRAIKVLARLLASHGTLFVGPSETGVLFHHDFVSTKVPLAFAFRKSSVLPGVRAPASTQAAKRPAALPGTGRSVRPPPRSIRAASKDVLAEPARPAGLLAQSAPDLAAATLLANEGRFAEAATCCEDHLQNQGPSANAFYLLGLVRDASGHQSESFACYRKALYLDPNHHEALIHLAFLMEQQGNKAAAQALRSRAQRLEQKARHA